MKNILAKLIVLTVVLIGFYGCSGDNGVGNTPQNRVSIVALTPAELGTGAQFTPLTISGTGFQAGATVDLGAGISVDDVEVADAQTIHLLASVLKSAQPGPRTVVVSTAGSSAQLTNGITVGDNAAPVANFIINPSAGTIASTFVLDASTSSDTDGKITNFKWEISDGTNPKGMKVQKQFDDQGEYTVRLIVTDNKGGISSLEKKLEVGDNLPPSASFAVFPNTGTQLTIFSFDASSSSDADGSIKTYHWDFGDNNESNGQRTTHRFAKEGEYNVVLEVKDSNGAVSTAQKKIDVVFFDKDKAEKEIIDVIKDFFYQFDNFENLSPDAVVRDFSDLPQCLGRAHELQIVINEQATVEDASQQFLSGPVVTSVNDHDGHAYSFNRFYGTRNDGTHYDGTATHYFTMIFENGSEWKICNFYVVK